MLKRREWAANGRDYRMPARPVVVVCLDGCADEYLDAALARDLMPNVRAMSVAGYRGMARGALPSFTNVNNAAIVTGGPPAVHGISGNYFLDPETGDEVMMNSARYLRAETILARAAQAGVRTAFVTAKEKLRDILSRDLQGIAFSAEKAGDAVRQTHGIDGVEKLVGQPAPPIYSAEASLFVLRAGVALIEAGLAELLYLSLTDFVQHKHAPEEPQALDFYAQIDREIGRLLQQGAVVALTADHGMNAKQTPDGAPNVIYLESVLKAEVGPEVTVILPITDPYVLHHGALGSFACVHMRGALPERASHTARDVIDFALGAPAAGDRLARAASLLSGMEGVTEVYTRAEAARKLELPADRIGDLVVMSGRNVVLGRTPEYHDLSAVAGGLRSHGGRYEEMVPLILSEPLRGRLAACAAGDPRNFDIFDFAINGA